MLTKHTSITQGHKNYSGSQFSAEITCLKTIAESETNLNQETNDECEDTMRMKTEEYDSEGAEENDQHL